MLTLVKTAGAAMTKLSHMTRPTLMMPSWLPCRRKADGGATRLLAGFAAAVSVAMRVPYSSAPVRATR